MQLAPRGGFRAETSEDRRQRARALAALFAAGGLVSPVVLVSTWSGTVPGWETIDERGIRVTIVLALATAGLLARYGRHVGPRLCTAFTAGGTLLIGACQVLAGGGSASAGYALLYVWVVLHAALYFGVGIVALHVGFSVAVQVTALALLGEQGALAPLLALSVGTQVAASLVVASLARRLRGLADTDPLTGLGNRRVIDRTLAYEFELDRRDPQRSTCVALFDLDGFKQINDRLGHQAGDELLAELATTWHALARRIDTLARTGGDEFALILPDCGLDDAATIVGRLQERTPSGVGASAGLAAWDGEESVAQLLQRADRALYAAKEDGPLVIADPPRRSAR